MPVQTTPLSADLRIDAGWIIPVEPRGQVLTGHSLLLKDGRIAALLPQALADSWHCQERLHLPEQVLIPGLINLHAHAAMSLMRGYADDLPLMDWLQQHIWPAEQRHVSHDFVRDGTLLACLEMLSGGITCFNDMYFFAEAAVAAASQAGMRISAGLILVDFPTAYAADPDGYLQKGLALRDLHGDDPLISFCLAPHAPYTVGDRSLEKILTYSEQLDLPVHMHLHETRDELQTSIARYGVRPLARLKALGLLSPGLIAVHSVHLDETEIGWLASHGCHVAHCPASNLKLGSGVAQITKLQAAGVNVGLGTDGAASNNRLDLLGEMRLAALLAKGASHDPTSLPAARALEMATLAGARALGLDAEIGSLLPGKQADVVAIDLARPGSQPCYDPLSDLVYSVGREQVSHVWVAGQLRVKAGVCLSLDGREIQRMAGRWKDAIRG